MTTLFFDTETTGLTKTRLDDTHPDQPMPVQLGLKMDDANRRERGAANLLIKPMGWTVEAPAARVTGITTAVAEMYGIHLITAVEAFLDLASKADTIVAHNASFDVTVMRRAVFVYSEYIDIPYVDPFEGKEVVCTMLSSMNIVKALPKRNGQWKWPKLSEAVKFFYNEELDGAHDALIDVRACARIYYTLVDQTGLPT